MTSTCLHVRMTLTDVSDFYANFPVQSAMLTCGVKAGVADVIAQLKEGCGAAFGKDESSASLEWRRNLAYIIYGGVFVGLMCNLEYNILFPYLFPENGVSTIINEVLLDNFVSGPLLWLPPAYLIKAVVYDYPLKEGLEKYIHDVQENGLLLQYWKVWVPAQTMSFSVVPDHLRIAFMASISFFWFILFSTLSSTTDKVDESDLDATNATKMDAAVVNQE